MSVLEYAPKFMELTLFTPIYMSYKKLKMNCFMVQLNTNLKEDMLVQKYVSYKNMYDTAINVETEIKQKKKFYYDQHGSKRKGYKQDNHNFQNQYKKPCEVYHNNSKDSHNR